MAYIVLGLSRADQPLRLMGSCASGHTCTTSGSTHRVTCYTLSGDLQSPGRRQRHDVWAISVQFASGLLRQAPPARDGRLDAGSQPGELGKTCGRVLAGLVHTISKLFQIPRLWDGVHSRLDTAQQRAAGEGGAYKCNPAPSRWLGSPSQFIVEVFRASYFCPNDLNIYDALKSESLFSSCVV